ncbi:MAG: hypothetical protein K2X93_09575 [Candidatus Obscuribacterales bacterium]|nr:hypothetical protein [Candidatus Obscuribacterales bacterium]
MIRTRSVYRVPLLVVLGFTFAPTDYCLAVERKAGYVRVDQEQDAETKDKERDAGKTKGSGEISNYEIFDKGMGNKNAFINSLHSELATKVDDHDRAVRLAKKAVDHAPDDATVRITYAEALFQKLVKLQELGVNDSKTYNDCVVNWLLVHRNMIGDEKGLSYDGIGIPGAHKFYEDEEHGIIAKKRLKELCGRLPKYWESNKRYLHAVLKPETSVSAGIVNVNLDGKVLTQKKKTNTSE